MQVLIHIEVANEFSGSYQKPIISWAKEQFPNLVTFDFDNFSEPSIMDYGIDLLKQAEQVIVIIDADTEDKAGSLVKFMNKLTKEKDKSQLVVLNGNNQVLEKMAKILRSGHFLKNVDLLEQKKLVKSFFNLG